MTINPTLPKSTVQVTQLGTSQVYYETYGQGRPLVLLHGLAGSGRWWRKNVLALATRYRLYLLDLIGFGAARGQPFALDQAAALLLAWTDAAGLDSFSMIGHSMGGLVAADMAAADPARIERLVLVDAAAVPINLKYLSGALGIVRSVRYMSLDFLPVLLTDTMRAGPLTVWSAIRQIMRADISQRLALVKADTLIIWGEKDQILPLPIAERLRERMPRAHYMLVPGAGHVSMWDRPELFNQAVLDFLQGG